MLMITIININFVIYLLTISLTISGRSTGKPLRIVLLLIMTDSGPRMLQVLSTSMLLEERQNPLFLRSFDNKTVVQHLMIFVEKYRSLLRAGGEIDNLYLLPITFLQHTIKSFDFRVIYLQASQLKKNYTWNSSHIISYISQS